MRRRGDYRVRRTYEKVTTANPSVLGWVRDTVGIPPEMCRSIDIHLPAAGAVSATVEIFVSPDQLEVLGRIMRSPDWEVLEGGGDGDG